MIKGNKIRRIKSSNKMRQKNRDVLLIGRSGKYKV